MINLLQTVSFTEIVIVIIMCALAIKEAISVIQFFIEFLRKIFNKETQKELKMKDIYEKIDNISNKQDTISEKMEESKDFYNKKIDLVTTQLSEQQEILDILIDSDRDDIKSWIVEKHHYFMKQGYIDQYSMDVIEKRAKHYFDEGGNSYIHTLLNNLRQLPVR